MRPADKVAIVTGGGSGPGAAIATTFAREGAKVTITGRCKEILGEIADSIGAAGGHALAVPGSVTDEADVQHAVQTTLATFGRVDVLVNNAGSLLHAGPLHETADEIWDGVMDVFPKGVFRFSRAVIPHMQRRGGGAIVNIGSVLGLKASPSFPAHPYAVAKAGVAMLTKTIAVHYAKDGIRCNCVAPALTETPLAEPLLKNAAMRKAMEAQHPLGRLGRPDDIAEAVLYLASDDAAWTTGTILTVDGAFGGDPGNVTIFESAGAMSVGTLLSMPRADGLFRRAIAQSGAAHQVMSAATARRVGHHLADKLGVQATREAIAAVPVDRLLAAQAELKADLLAHPDPERWGGEVVTSTLPWQPVVDGDVIPARPIDRIVAGAGARADVMVGTNTDDWRLFVVAHGAIDRITDQVLTGPVAVYGYQALAAYGLPVETALAAYRAAYPGASPGELLAAVQTDWWCRIPAIRLAEAHATSLAATFMYEFAWRSPAFNGLLGACHALEIGFVFDTLDKGPDQMLGPLLGTDPPQQLADTMHAAWVAFATNGDPGWPKYDLSRRATMRFDTTSEVVDDPRSVERELWAGVR